MQFKINLLTPDNGEKYVVGMSNAALSNIEGYQATDADLTITINRSVLETVMMAKVTFGDQIKAGKPKLDGNKEVYDQLKSTLVHFELGFEIMPGTQKDSVKEPEMNPFEQGKPGINSRRVRSITHSIIL